MYIVKKSIKCAWLGNLKEGQKIEGSQRAKDLAQKGYLEEYKTKVVERKPIKRKPKK